MIAASLDVSLVSICGLNENCTDYYRSTIATFGLMILFSVGNEFRTRTEGISRYDVLTLAARGVVELAIGVTFIVLGVATGRPSIVLLVVAVTAIVVTEVIVRRVRMRRSICGPGGGDL